MDTTKIKTIIVDVVTGVALLGVIYFGYTTFVKEASQEESTVAQEQVLTEANAISSALIATSKDLENLADTVSKSRTIFDNNAYKNLENFSQTIVKEPVGREYPFTKTQWKLDLKALEEKAQKSSSQQVAQVSTVVQSGDFEEGI